MRFGEGQVRRVWNKKPPEVRFFKHLIKSEGCWTTDLSKDKRGYARFALDARHPVLAHRFSYELFRKVKIPPSLCVLHKCDNTNCVNPDHLYLGTRTENGIDMRVRKRVLGSKNGYAKLNENDVVEIRRLRKTGITYRELAFKFGVGVQNICHIVKGRRWGHIY